jgi:uncharacterized metal-binding protein YceD (DUF177 family)
MKQKHSPSEPELSRPLRVEKISTNGVEESIVAMPVERKALAERFDLIDIQELTAKLQVTPKQMGLNFLVEGAVKAKVTQRCVVTLEPLAAEVEQTISVHFAAPAFIDSNQSERTLEEEDMEPITGGIIDLGELAAQHFGLALDPYPRKPGLPPVEIVVGTPPTKDNPFAKLTLLKNKREE